MTMLIRVQRVGERWSVDFDATDSQLFVSRAAALAAALHHAGAVASNGPCSLEIERCGEFDNDIERMVVTGDTGSLKLDRCEA